MRHRGQALVVVAVVIGVLVSLIIWSLDIATTRMLLRRAGDAADHAALVGMRAVRPESLVAGHPALDPAQAVPLARSALEQRLAPLAPWLTMPPSTLAAQAGIEVAEQGGVACGRSAAAGPAICVQLVLPVRRVVGGTTDYVLTAWHIWREPR